MKNIQAKFKLNNNLIIILVSISILLIFVNSQTQKQEKICQSQSRFFVFPQIPQQPSLSQIPISPKSCYADCSFCQIQTGVCQQCYRPYFVKGLDGTCQLNNNYQLESSRNEIIVGNGFVPSRSWNLFNKLTNCTNKLNLKVMGYYASQQIQYQRTLSSHDYITIKFLLIGINWQAGTTLNVTVFGTNSTSQKQLCSITLSYSNQIPKQRLCSSTAADQRYSVQYKVKDVQSRQIKILFSGNMADNGDNVTFWGISTFLLISGKCHSNCQTCDFSPNQNSCQSCKNFFTLSSNRSCNTCPTGFKPATQSNYCQKCAIEFQTCEINNVLCYYRQRFTENEQNKILCKLIENKTNYNDTKFDDRMAFSDTLITVDGRSNITRCGLYTFVGQAGKSSTITRILATTINHIAISLSFNIFIIDYDPSDRINQNQSFSIFIDGVFMEAYSLQLNASSNVCGNKSLQQVFTTFSPTRFFQHSKSKNVNISISSQAKKWGIRDLRIMYQSCDQNCLNCSITQGCITCKNYAKLINGSCTKCLIGTVANPNNTGLSDIDLCRPCSDSNCLRCDIDANICQKCFQGYFIFQKICEKSPDVANPINGSIFNTQFWEYVPIDSTQVCGIKLIDQSLISFFIVQNKLIGKFKIPMPLISVKIQFRLIKIDNWQSNQYLDLYLNDLRVMHKNFLNRGNKICFIQSQNQQITFEQYVLESSNSSLKVQFQVINAGQSKRKFGISNFTILPFGCKDCSKYGFQYKVQYNTDNYLQAQIAFNRVYRNNNPTLFKEIFVLTINQQKINYEIIANDSIRYLIRAIPNSQIINGQLTVTCLYPEKVVTNVDEPVLNQQEFFQVNSVFSDSRRLQESGTPSSSKFLDNNVASTFVQRYNPLKTSFTQGKFYAAQGLRIFFEILSRIVIYVGFASFIIGCQTPFTHLMHNFQKIWVHIFVASLTIHPLLKTTLIGFRQTQDQNIAIRPQSWQTGIPKQLYYDAPTYYQQYYHDITFFRNIYSIGAAFASLLFIYIVLNLVFRFWKNKPRALSTSKFYRHMKITYLKRPYFYFNSIIFYQYFTLVLACSLQFIDLTSSTNRQPFIVLNAIATVVAFIIATVYPLVHFIYMKYKQSVMYQQIDGVTRFKNRYGQIFFRFLPKSLWVKFTEQEQIGYKQFLYNLLRFGQLWWFSLVVALMYRNPFAQAFLLMLTNATHFVILLFSSLNYTRVFKILKLIQLLFFIGIQILLLVSSSLIETIQASSYETVGIVGVIFIFVIVFISLIRTFYTILKIYRQYDDPQSKQPGSIHDQQMRNTKYFDSIRTQTDDNDENQGKNQ